MFPGLNEQMDLIRQGVVDLLPESELAEKIENSIKKNLPLNIKLGADPSRPDLHIGHAVVLHKMRQFQDLGHEATLIIGDFTAMIGDPTGKSKTRPQLTLEQTKEYGQSYIDQATIILRNDRLYVKYNSEWLNSMNFVDVVKLASNYTVAQMLERDDFSNRYKSSTPISIHEFLYPLAQGMDSVVIKSDVELGGTDQKFNLLVGRELQKQYGVPAQCILTMPILEGTDGVQKMSKSLDNYIALTDSPKDMFGKTMSIPDDMITRYMLYAAFFTNEEIKAVEEGLKDGSVHPRNAKVNTAMKIVELYHGSEQAKSAFDEFERIFVNKDVPDVIDEMKLDIESSEMPLADLLVSTNLAPSKKESRRLIEQGGVYIDGEKQTDPFSKVNLVEKKLLKVGKRKFLYVQV
ncbi:MAG: tyrosine--tRNA ligase [Candidatus Kapabacteria bacterium]|nr:tyrosine--tRNA ligase [Ignavibacteriota bacterium]MCW5886237.1 tyrosine--tRNA ligase [Candidatus Kapabacteria bacterium]